jgi:histidine triad (HIT) family protein
MDCLFCEIIKNPKKEKIIYEDKNFFVIPSLRAVCPGHIMVLPKKHTDFLFNMQEEEYLELMKLTRKIAKVLQKAYGSKTVGIMLNGLEILHVHLHLVPRNKFGELDQKNPKELSKKELEETANKIKKIIAGEKLWKKKFLEKVFTYFLE